MATTRLSTWGKALLLSLLVAASAAARPIQFQQQQQQQGWRRRSLLEFEDLDHVGCNGPTIGSKDASSRGACEALCAAESRCRAYSWNIAEQRCFLKATGCTSQDKNPNNLSGRQISVVGNSLSAFYDRLDGVGCNGPDVEMYSKVESREVCEELCSTHSDCLAYSYNTENNKCYLKEEGCADRDENGGNDSGIKVPGLSLLNADAIQVAWDRLDRVGCNGPTIGVRSAPTRDMCEVACEANDECKAYSWNIDEARCFLKGTFCLDRDDNPNNLSGVKLDLDPDLGLKTDAPPEMEAQKMEAHEMVAQVAPTDAPTPAPTAADPPAPSKVDLQEGLVCIAPDLEWIPQIDQATCEQICRANPGCKAFSYLISEIVCFLKDNCVDTADDPNFVSGIFI